jgi:hypothetical protein
MLVVGNGGLSNWCLSVALPPSALVTLDALLDRLIPEDDSPGARAAGVDRYILRQLTGDCAHEAVALTLGFTQLDAEAGFRHDGVSFATLTTAQQDVILSDLEAGRAVTPWPAEISATAFFNRLVDLAHEGFYADPSNGGNRDAISWRMIGYDPHLPEFPSSTPP